jgi:hypothetical protein
MIKMVVVVVVVVVAAATTIMNAILNTTSRHPMSSLFLRLLDQNFVRFVT